MSIEERIITALSPIVSEIMPNVYTGDSLEYIEFNYNEIPAVIADSTTDTYRCIVQVHYYLPSKQNPTATKKQIIEALNDAGFTMPSITNASDQNGQHYVFECEGIEVF